MKLDKNNKITKKSNLHKKNRTLKKLNNCIFLFGYGSLMNDCSRKKTHKKISKKYPVVLNEKFGYVRKWNTIIPKNKLVLGIEKNHNKDTSINGVLFKVCKGCIKEFLKREKRYNIKKINKKHIIFNKNRPYDFNKYEVYTFATKNGFNNSIKKNKSLKIPKYYKNIINKSFQHYDKKFKNTFFKTTQ